MELRYARDILREMPVKESGGKKQELAGIPFRIGCQYGTCERRGGRQDDWEQAASHCRAVLSVWDKPMERSLVKTDH